MHGHYQTYTIPGFEYLLWTLDVCRPLDTSVHSIHTCSHSLLSSFSMWSLPCMLSSGHLQHVAVSNQGWNWSWTRGIFLNCSSTPRKLEGIGSARDQVDDRWRRWEGQSRDTEIPTELSLSNHIDCLNPHSYCKKDKQGGKGTCRRQDTDKEND